MSVTQFAQMFRDRVRRWPDRVCLRHKRDGQWEDITWREVDRFVRHTALGLVELGFQHGDRVALLSENRPEWAIMDLATLCLGGSVATIYPTNTPPQCAYIVKDADARFAAVSNYYQLEKLMKMRKTLPKLEKIIIFDPLKDITDTDPIVISMVDLRDLGRRFEDPEEFDRRADAVSQEDILTLIYTSGTTGDPKGVVLTHRNMFSNVESVLKILDVEKGDTCLSFLPLSHSFERMAGQFTMLYAGIPIAYAESFDALVKNIGEVKPSVMVAVPRMYEKVHARIISEVETGGIVQKQVFLRAMSVGKQVSALKLAKKPLPLALRIQYELACTLVFKKFHDLLGGRFRFFVSGGAPLAQELAEFFHAAGIVILEGYGLTETSPVITSNTMDSLKFGTVGRPVPGVEVRIADDGEILVRGPNVMKEYYKKLDATTEVIDENFWLHTGDIGELDAEGYLKITDRKKDLIVTAGGKNVAPQNIENLFKMSRYVENINVVGDRRKFLTAVIVPSFGELELFAAQQGLKYEDHKQLVENPAVVELFHNEVDQINSHLARFEKIKKYVVSNVEFSMENNMLTPSLKVKRKVVNSYFAEQIERLYNE